MKKLAPKTVIILFVVVFVPLSGMFAHRANALKLFGQQLNPVRWLASDMDNWTNNFLYAVGVETPIQLIVGCKMETLLASNGDKAKIDLCIQKGGGASQIVPSNFEAPPEEPEEGGYISPSLLGLSTGLFTNIATQKDAYPVNLAIYWDSVKKDSLITPKSAYAGIGEELLRVTALDLWQSMRNIAYLLFFIALVAIGFMVMFRYKINPQTTMTVQAALPKLVVVLLLVTFSYPIGALAISLMATFSRMAFMIHVSPTSLPASIAVQAVTLAGAFNPVGLVTGQALVLGLLIIALILGLLLTLIAVLISMITRVARIIAMTIFAPLQLTLGVLPGKEGAITDWFKALIANMLAIPAMILMVHIGLDIGLTAGASAGSTAIQNSGAILGVGITTVISQFIGYVLCVWFVWNARKAPSWIEGALGVGGGWVPGQKPKPTGGKK